MSKNDKKRCVVSNETHKQSAMPESWNMTEALPPCPFKKQQRAFMEVPLHNSIIGNFMVRQDRLEKTNLQLFAHLENSEWFSIISVTFLRSTFLQNSNKHNW